jgi:hypothetical protein
MKIYLAASFASRARIRPIRDRLWEMGHDVVSTWLDESVPLPGMSRETFERKLGLKDLCESASADLVIVDLLEPSTTGGRDVEYGLALGRFQRQMVWLVGPRQGVFHYLADACFDSWSECLAHLAVPPNPLVHWVEPDMEKVLMAPQAWLEREGNND